MTRVKVQLLSLGGWARY